MIKNALTALTFSAACAAVAPAVAQADDHVCVTRLVPGHYELVEHRVRVPGQVTYQERRVEVPGYWRTVTKEVQIPGRYEPRQERVWVPERWVEESSHRRPGVRVEAGPVTVKLGGQRYSNRRLIPGHYQTVTKQVWIAPSCEQRQVREWVPATYRIERVPVRTPDRFEVRQVRTWIPASVQTCCQGRPAPRPVQRAPESCEPEQPARRVHRGERRESAQPAPAPRSHRRRGARISVEFNPFR